MKKEVVARFTWNKAEIRALLIEDLAKSGIKIDEGESALRFTDMVVIFEIYPLERARMSTDKTSGQGEGEGERPPGELFKGGQDGKNKRYV